MGNLAVAQRPLLERLRWLRLTPFDQSTAEGRAQERHRRVALTAAAAALAKALSVGSALISIPLTLNYLGAERFGMWMTISSLIAMLAFADFGIANGVLNTVSSAHGRGDRAAVLRAISSGFALLFTIALVLSAAFAIAYRFVPWAQVFNVEGALAKAEAGPALAIFIVCFAFSIPLAVVQRTQMGLQQGFRASLWQCFGSLLGLVGILIAISANAGLPWLVLAFAGAPLIAAVLNSLHYFFKVHPDLIPKASTVSILECKNLLQIGALFFLLQLVVAIAYASDTLLISHLLGASHVAAYAVPEKIFSLISMITAMALAPLWPAYGEAIARGDRAWVRKTFAKSVVGTSTIVCAVSTVLFFAAPSLVAAWTGEAVVVAASMLIALAVWKVFEATGNAIAMFLNGAGIVKLQVWIASLTAAVAFGLKLVLIPEIGVAGAIWATTIAYLMCALLPYAVFIPRLKILAK